jgi:hypothetical protein
MRPGYLPEVVFLIDDQTLSRSVEQELLVFSTASTVQAAPPGHPNPAITLPPIQR